MSEVAAPSSPYKGLAAFEDSAVDALFFFGRDRDSEVIAANLMASRVNVLIGIREDALALLDAFKASIPNLLSNRLRLENLDRAGGEAAIRGPLNRFNELVPVGRRVDVEPALVGAVLDEVAAGRVEL